MPEEDNILVYKFVTQNPGKEYNCHVDGILLFSKRARNPCLSSKQWPFHFQEIYTD